MINPKLTAESIGSGLRPWAWVAYHHDGEWCDGSRPMFTSREAALRAGTQILAWKTRVTRRVTLH